MKKKLLTLIILIITLFAMLFPHSVEAHFLATDHNIGAILHVDPNDDPIAGSQASFFFEFKDTQNKFRPGDCDCTFSILENGTEIYSQPLFQNNQNPSLSNASVFYTFPKIDVYQIQVIGKPQSPYGFQPFTLTWNFRVDQEATSQDNLRQENNNFFATHLVHLIGLGVIVLIFLIYLVCKLFNKKHPMPKGGEKKDDKEDFRDMY